MRPTCVVYTHIHTKYTIYAHPYMSCHTLYIGGAVLHHVVDLDGPVLLRLRLPVTRVHHTHCDLRGDDDRVELLPAVRGGLQAGIYTYILSYYCI